MTANFVRILSEAVDTATNEFQRLSISLTESSTGYNLKQYNISVLCQSSTKVKHLSTACRYHNTPTYSTLLWVTRKQSAVEGKWKMEGETIATFKRLMITIMRVCLLSQKTFKIITLFTTSLFFRAVVRSHAKLVCFVVKSSLVYTVCCCTKITGTIC